MLTIVDITLALGVCQFEYQGKMILNTNISWMTRPLDRAEGFNRKSFIYGASTTFSGKVGFLLQLHNEDKI